MGSLKTQTMGSLMFSSVGAKLWVTQVEHCRVSKQESKCKSVFCQGHSAFEAVRVYMITWLDMICNLRFQRTCSLRALANAKIQGNKLHELFQLIQW